MKDRTFRNRPVKRGRRSPVRREVVILGLAALVVVVLAVFGGFIKAGDVTIGPISITVGR